jgi:hypothetical protein
MKNFDTRTYNLSDFQEWNNSRQLVLSPDFQRRAVWTTIAKSYLVDTILRGKPMPKIILTQSLEDGKNIRTVVDGQQRLRALLEYMDDGFQVSKIHNEEYGGMFFSELPESVQSDVLQYEIGVDLLFNKDTTDILDIFSRLNTYSVKLNTTELLNAKYLGVFKTDIQKIGRQFLPYWVESKVLTSKKITRMAEIGLTADLFTVLLEGIRPVKQLPNIYKRYDAELTGEAQKKYLAARSAFRQVMGVIGKMYPPEDLALTNYRRIHLFYTLFSVVAVLEGVYPDAERFEELCADIPRVSPGRLRIFFDDFSSRFDELLEDQKGADGGWIRFIQDARRATTDQLARERRAEFLLVELGKYLGQ